MIMNEYKMRPATKSEDIANEDFRIASELNHKSSELALKYCDLESYFLGKYKSIIFEVDNNEKLAEFLSDYYSYTSVLIQYQVLDLLERYINKFKEKCEKIKSKFQPSQPGII